MPALIDEADNPVERAYTAWPDRLYVIDRDGRIAHKSPAGPFGFKPADVEATLKRSSEAMRRETQQNDREARERLQGMRDRHEHHDAHYVRHFPSWFARPDGTASATAL